MSHLLTPDGKSDGNNVGSYPLGLGDVHTRSHPLNDPVQ